MSFDWYVEWAAKKDWEWGEDEEKGFKRRNRGKIMGYKRVTSRDSISEWLLSEYDG